MEEDKKIDPSATEVGETSEAPEVPEIPELEELTPEEIDRLKDKKIKNLISVVILLAGLFVGSLFVDVVQMIRGGGFSQHALSTTDVFSSAGKTWVAYSEPIVRLQVINDSSCGDACKPDEVLVGLKQALPTLLTQSVDSNSDAGKKLIAQFGIKTLPAFVFSKEITQTDLFSKAQPFLQQQGDFYAVKSGEAGFPVGEYLSGPNVSATDIKIGSDDSQVKVVAFSDFTNPSDAQAWQTLVTPMLKDYSDKIQFVFDNYYSPDSTVAAKAALEAECANAQGKFADYATKLFANQAVWSKMTDPTGLLEAYATQLGMNSGTFNQCVSSKQFQSQLDASAQLGQSFGVQGTPSIFVGSKLQDQTVKYADLQTAINGQLGQ